VALTNAEKQKAHRRRMAEKMERMVNALESIARPFPPNCNWEDQAQACRVVASEALNSTDPAKS